MFAPYKIIHFTKGCNFACPSGSLKSIAICHGVVPKYWSNHKDILTYSTSITVCTSFNFELFPELKLNPHIYIIGAGAVGKALAVSLSLAGRQVTLLRGSRDDGASYSEQIRVHYKGKTLLDAEIPVSSLKNFTEFQGVVVLTNKSFGNRALAEKLKSRAKNTPLVLLQNGLGVEEPFLKGRFTEVYRCVLFVTSQQEGQHISYKPVDISPIGVIRNKSTNLKDIVGALNCTHFKFRAETEIQKVIWEKAVANCVFNSICPLLETDNGIFHRQPEVFELARCIIGECVALADEMGIKLEPIVLETMVLTISRKSDGQIISTLQDIRNGRETEIDTLNLEVARIAGKLGKAQAVATTKLLGELTQMKSFINLKS